MAALTELRVAIPEGAVVTLEAMQHVARLVCPPGCAPRCVVWVAGTDRLLVYIQR